MAMLGGLVLLLVVLPRAPATTWVWRALPDQPASQTRTQHWSAVGRAHVFPGPTTGSQPAFPPATLKVSDQSNSNHVSITDGPPTARSPSRSGPGPPLLPLGSKDKQGSVRFPEEDLSGPNEQSSRRNNTGKPKKRKLNVSDPNSPYALIHEFFQEDDKQKTTGIVPDIELSTNEIDDLAGLDPSEVHLSDGDLLVLRGFNFPHSYSFENPWPPIDDYQAPYRPPKLPPPFFSAPDANAVGFGPLPGNGTDLGPPPLITYFSPYNITDADFFPPPEFYLPPPEYYTPYNESDPSFFLPPGPRLPYNESDPWFLLPPPALYPPDYYSPFHVPEVDVSQPRDSLPHSGYYFPDNGSEPGYPPHKDLFPTEKDFPTTNRSCLYSSHLPDLNQPDNYYPRQNESTSSRSGEIFPDRNEYEPPDGLGNKSTAVLSDSGRRLPPETYQFQNLPNKGEAGLITTHPDSVLTTGKYSSLHDQANSVELSTQPAPITGFTFPSEEGIPDLTQYYFPDFGKKIQGRTTTIAPPMSTVRKASLNKPHNLFPREDVENRPWPYRIRSHSSMPSIPSVSPRYREPLTPSPHLLQFPARTRRPRPPKPSLEGDTDVNFKPPLPPYNPQAELLPAKHPGTVPLTPLRRGTHTATKHPGTVPLTPLRHGVRWKAPTVTSGPLVTAKEPGVLQAFNRNARGPLRYQPSAQPAVPKHRKGGRSWSGSAAEFYDRRPTPVEQESSSSHGTTKSQHSSGRGPPDSAAHSSKREKHVPETGVNAEHEKPSQWVSIVTTDHYSNSQTRERGSYIAPTTYRPGQARVTQVLPDGDGKPVRTVSFYRTEPNGQEYSYTYKLT